MSVADVISGAKRWHVEQGDNLASLRSIPDATVDAIVSDPPAWISFMNRAWDKGDEFLGFEERCREMLRVAKPGAHALIWALPRTAHMTASALAGAGWEIRDVISDVIAADLSLLRFVETLTEEQRDALARALESQASPALLQIFGQGFPKSLNVSKALDDAAGAERAVVGSGKSGRRGVVNFGFHGEHEVSVPATDLAHVFSGFGTALKPAVEFWIVARKPLAGTVAANVAEHGTGAINVDGCRVGASGGTRGSDYAKTGLFGVGGKATIEDINAGRWPTNLVLEHAPGCRAVGTRRVKASASDGGGTGGIWSGVSNKPCGPTYGDADGREEVTEYECVPGCPVRILDEQSGESTSTASDKRNGADTGGVFAFGRKDARVRGHNDSGGASRFFPGFLYEPKADRRTREAGLAGRETGRITDGRKAVSDRPYLRAETERRNTHPTVKSDDLMRWLVRLVLPPRRDEQPAPLVLDPYNGSGSTGRAAMMEGARYLGLEREQEYADISRDRIRDAEVNGPVKREPVAREAKGQTDLMALFQEVKS